MNQVSTAEAEAARVPTRPKPSTVRHSDFFEASMLLQEDLGHEIITGSELSIEKANSSQVKSAVKAVSLRGNSGVSGLDGGLDGGAGGGTGGNAASSDDIVDHGDAHRLSGPSERAKEIIEKKIQSLPPSMAKSYSSFVTADKMRHINDLAIPGGYSKIRNETHKAMQVSNPLRAHVTQFVHAASPHGETAAAVVARNSASGKPVAGHQRESGLSGGHRKRHNALRDRIIH